MSSVLMATGRSPVPDMNIAETTDTQRREILEGFDAYCGTYTLHPEDNMVIHHVQASRLPNWEGTDQVRYYEFTGNWLKIYSAPISANEQEWVVYVEWQRV